MKLVRYSVHGSATRLGSLVDDRVRCLNVNALVAYLSAHLTLRPGDIVSTGTLAGVGLTRTPPVLLKGGDVVRMAITGLGEESSRWS